MECNTVYCQVGKTVLRPSFTEALLLRSAVIYGSFDMEVSEKKHNKTREQRRRRLDERVEELNVIMSNYKYRDLQYYAV